MHRAHRTVAFLATAVLALSACTADTEGVERRTIERDDDTRAGGVADASAGSPDDTASPTPVPDPASTASPDPEQQPTGPFVILRRDDGFSDADVALLEGLDGVISVGGSRRDDLELTGSFDEDGIRRDAFPQGYRVEVSTLALDGDDAPEPGTAWLTDVGAQFRPVGVGASLSFTAGGERLRITRVLAADDDLGSVEVIVNGTDGDRLGVEPRDRLFLVTAVDTDAEALAATARELLGLEGPRGAEVREPGRGRITLGTVATKSRFGELAFRPASGRQVQADPAWVEANIEARRIEPFGTVRCHRLVLDDLAAVAADVEAAGLSDWWEPTGGGCFNPRRIGEGRSLSQHAYGIAFDINVDFSVPGLGPVPPDEIIAAFERHGFGWGGRFPSPDNHHWEWVGYPND